MIYDRQVSLKDSVSIPSHHQPSFKKLLCELQHHPLRHAIFWASFAIASPAWSLSMTESTSAAANKDAVTPVTRVPTEDSGFYSLQSKSFKASQNDRSVDLSAPQFSKQAAKTHGKTSRKAIDLEMRSIAETHLPQFDGVAIADQPEIPQRIEEVAQAKAAQPVLSSSTPSLVNNSCWQDPSERNNCTFAQSDVVLGQAAPDRELGVLRLREELRASDPELGVLRARPLPMQGETPLDPELGTLRLQERTLQLPPVAARQPSVYLLARVDYFKTSNVFSGVDPVDDGLIRSGLTLFYAPAIGPQTYIVTSIDANLIRYANLGSVKVPDRRLSLNYNELRYRVGLLQRLSPRMFGEFGWSNQQLYATKTGLQDALRGDQFLNDHSVRLELSRQDPLSPQLSLNTFYQFRASFATPSDRDRLINSFISSLSYGLSPSFQAAIDYQLAWSHFTQQPRDDVYHQLVARLTYTITPQSQFNVFGGFSFGNSSDTRIDFNGFILGAGFVLNLPLF